MGKVKSFRTDMNYWKVATIILALVIVTSQFGWVTIHPKHAVYKASELVPKAMAAELYPEFTCPCCGAPLNKEDPCCGAMTEMIDFIDARVKEGLTEDEIMLAMVKEFGMERLTSESKRIEIRQKLIDQAPKDAPQLELSEDSHDLGSVKAGGDVISTDFEIKNSGASELIINKLDSSCGCTSATVIYRGEEGPRFGMAGHGFDNPEDWSVAIAPGDSAILRVYYDPTMHADLIGPVTRTVTVYSNDPVDFAKKVTITLEQVE